MIPWYGWCILASLAASFVGLFFMHRYCFKSEKDRQFKIAAVAATAALLAAAAFWGVAVYVESNTPTEYVTVHYSCEWVVDAYHCTQS